MLLDDCAQCGTRGFARLRSVGFVQQVVDANRDLNGARHETKGESTVNNTTEVRAALRELVDAHFIPHVWLPVVLLLVAVGALIVLVFGILHVQPGTEVVPPDFRAAVAFKAVICWTVSTFCAYVAGFILGRLYKRA
jgi:hypothetical protein